MAPPYRLPDDLVAKLANVGRRVRYSELHIKICERFLNVSGLDVSQGYASNRTTPNTTPNTSPAKNIPKNPSITPDGSPVKAKGIIFKTEHEVIQEAVEDAFGVDNTTKGEPSVPLFNLGLEKKRARVEDDSDNEETATAEDVAKKGSTNSTTFTRRAIKSLPHRKADPVPIAHSATSQVTAQPTKLPPDEIISQLEEDNNPFLVSSDSMASS